MKRLRSAYRFAVTVLLLGENVIAKYAKTFNSRRVQSDEEIIACIESTENNDLKEYTDPLWFVEKMDIFSQAEITSRCAYQLVPSTGTATTVDIHCEWSEDDVSRGKGEAYDFVEQACNQTNGVMYLAHQLKTTHSYTGNNITAVTETYTHRNVPLCLAPDCTAEIVLDKLGTLNCSQWEIFNNIFSINWTHKNSVEDSCHHDFNVASTYMDEDCYTKRSYNEFDDSNCAYFRDDSTRICDYSSFSEPDGVDFDSEFCEGLGDDMQADLYKFSFKNFGTYDGYPNETHYIVNLPTCLQRGCDVKAYYLENLIPYHGINIIDATSKDGDFPDFIAAIEKTTGIGIDSVSESADLCFEGSNKSKKSGGKSKKTKSPSGKKSQKSVVKSNKTKSPSGKSNKTKSPKVISSVNSLSVENSKSAKKVKKVKKTKTLRRQRKLMSILHID